jgi:hypothetical protein
VKKADATTDIKSDKYINTKVTKQKRQETGQSEVNDETKKKQSIGK